MQYLAAYALAGLSGNEPTADQVTAILKATGGKFDQGQVKKVVDSLKGKKIDALIKSGLGKVGSVGSGSGSGSVAAKTPAPARKEQPKKEAPKKEQPKPEQEEEYGAGDLFG